MPEGKTAHPLRSRGKSGQVGWQRVRAALTLPLVCENGIFRLLFLTHLDCCSISQKLWWASPPFRPTYAGANVGHPSHPSSVLFSYWVLCQEASQGLNFLLSRFPSPVRGDGVDGLLISPVQWLVCCKSRHEEFPARWLFAAHGASSCKVPPLF